MPELPEVETVRRSIAPHAVGRTIERVKVNLPGMVKGCEITYLTDNIIGKEIKRIDRRGKFLLLRLSQGYTLVVHLGMSGRFYYAGEEPYGGFPKHTHVLFLLNDGGFLVYNDPRRFGRINLCRQPEKEVSAIRLMGPEPLGNSCTMDYLRDELKKRRGKIKQLLLDQNLIAGIGNIYADEILFDACIHPERSGQSLTPLETARLFQSIRRVLNQGVRHRGTTISDYVDGRGVPGEFQKHLKVYGREGEPCSVCASEIQRIRVAGRSTYFCPVCQCLEQGKGSEGD
ncbi:MAG: bifunctional DNA-formamidopyrimidine glycosylase/DNA-(apurinic or apyrimidinic site) lyase [Firmicutes bacterium]|nr:bifunctional DNA-formamidopyrimidine glycosylase/DNA-(apurinic or apyrimidinic site) lyase [Bacillota bacterium]